MNWIWRVTVDVYVIIGNLHCEPIHGLSSKYVLSLFYCWLWVCDLLFVVYANHLYSCQFCWWSDSVRGLYDLNYCTVGASEWLAIPFTDVWCNDEWVGRTHPADDRRTTTCTWRAPHLMLRSTLVDQRGALSIKKGLGQTYWCGQQASPGHHTSRGMGTSLGLGRSE